MCFKLIALVLKKAHEEGILPDEQPIYLADVKENEDKKAVCLPPLLSSTSTSEPKEKGVNFQSESQLS